ncbi:uncharacterized protein ATNIH1004_001072 [Aspergillus tanneri]|uniref:Uncharacterized protein n=1 Tax=Aspergillus tanneri TaxID=1220188 RepID=A0A5M9MZ90_9EURO|nr:uncharacterized protein ATNIH1004_001072 [Aspergillus tanneri]KAA8652168.1 hypothetical protein ATNIH1004_001072 [Aspergillus tanneri]
MSADSRRTNSRLGTSRPPCCGSAGRALAPHCHHRHRQSPCMSSSPSNSERSCKPPQRVSHCYVRNCMAIASPTHSRGDINIAHVSTTITTTIDTADLHPLVDLAAEIHHNIQTIDHHPLTAFYLPDFIVTNLRLAPPPLRKWDWGKSLSSIVDFHHLERRESVDSVPSYRCVSESQRDGTPLWRVRVNLDPVAMERLQQDRLLGGLEKWPT